MVDEPVIVTGGSVQLEISDKFKDNGQGKGKKKMKLEGQKLLSLWVNDEKVRDLSQTDKVRIVSEDA